MFIKLNIPKMPVAEKKRVLRNRLPVDAEKQIKRQELKRLNDAITAESKLNQWLIKLGYIPVAKYNAKGESPEEKSLLDCHIFVTYWHSRRESNMYYTHIYKHLYNPYVANRIEQLITE